MVIPKRLAKTACEMYRGSQIRCLVVVETYRELSFFKKDKLKTCPSTTFYLQVIGNDMEYF